VGTGSKSSDAVFVAGVLPPWAAYASLERADPKTLLTAPVLEAFAAHRGIPSALRLENEREKSLDDARKGAIALSRVRIALAYESTPDAIAVSGWKSPKRPIDQLRVAIAKALVGVESTAKPGEPAATSTTAAYDLKPLDQLAKGAGPIAIAAAYNAALLSLDGAQRFTGEADGGPKGVAEQKAAYEAAIKRLDDFAKVKNADKARVDKARELANGPRETVKLLDKAPKAKP
jgi:hypothetical protein